MRPLDYPLLADENVDPDVVAVLRAAGKDVQTVMEEGLGGASDQRVLQHAHEHGRVVLTHDADFGRLVVLAGEPFTGIVHVRLGHASATFVQGTLEALDNSGLSASPPFVLVAARRGDHVRLRLREHAEAIEEGLT